MGENNNPNGFRTPQFILGLIITFLVIGGLILLTVESINRADNFDNIKYILGVTLPLIGTWVGTVLAFYFTSENFESANKNVRSLVNQVTTTAEKLRNILAKEVMIKKDQIKGFTLAKDKGDADYTVKDLTDQIIQNGMNRLPIFNYNGSVKYVVHRSILDRYIAENYGNQIKPIEVTVADLLKNNSDINSYFNSYAVIGEDDSLSIAKRKMDSKTGCLDIFVTKTGSTNEPVTGWITNLIISEKSKV